MYERYIGKGREDMFLTNIKFKRNWQGIALGASLLIGAGLSLSPALCHAAQAAKAKETAPAAPTNPTLTPFEEGVHFKRIPIDVAETPVVEEFAKEDKGKIKVVEFFNYACHWCQNLEPYVAEWLKQKPEYVAFYRIPVNFQPSWRPLSKTYYAADSLGVLDKIHERLFKALINENLLDSKDETIIDFIVRQGVDKAAFTKAYNSFTVDSRLRWANNMARAYRITSIPTIVVIGPKESYYTQSSMAGSEGHIFEVINFLSEKEYQQFAQKSAPNKTGNKESASKKLSKAH